jgi:hypothetical protein
MDRYAIQTLSLTWAIISGKEWPKIDADSLGQL